MRKLAFCKWENKGADQLQGNHAADQRLSFCYIESTIPLLPKSEISNLQPSSLAAKTGFCLIWSETPENRFSPSQAQLGCSSAYGTNIDRVTYHFLNQRTIGPVNAHLIS